MDDNLTLEYFLSLLDRAENVFQKDKAEYNVFICGGIHIGAELVGGFPEFLFGGVIHKKS